ncbi:Methionine--tRNA ligase [subsurface metagenome]
MIEKYFQGEIPEPGVGNELDKKIIEGGKALPGTIKESVNRMELNSALDSVLKYIRIINKYIEQTAPWNLHKKGEIEELKTVLYSACEGFRLVTILLAPIILNKAKTALSVFSEKDMKHIQDINTDEQFLTWGKLKPGIKIKAIKSIFPRIKGDTRINHDKGGNRPKEDRVEDWQGAEKIDMEYFNRIDIRVGKILEAAPVKRSKTLLKITLDLGEEKRQIVAGIAEHYKAEELIGKEIVVLVNLKPAKIMGIKSNGMLLAATDKGNLSVISVDRDIKPGSKVS